MYVFTFFVCSTYALNNNWFFSLLFQVKKLRFEKLWFDNVRNYNDQLPDEILPPIKFSTCGKSSQFPTKKSEEEEEKKDLFWSCRVNFNHFFFGRFDTVWEHSLFRMWQKQRTYRSWWYESSCSWASMHGDNGVVGVWKWEILVSM